MKSTLLRRVKITWQRLRFLTDAQQLSLLQAPQPGTLWQGRWAPRCIQLWPSSAQRPQPAGRRPAARSDPAEAALLQGLGGMAAVSPASSTSFSPVPPPPPYAPGAQSMALATRGRAPQSGTLQVGRLATDSQEPPAGF